MTQLVAATEGAAQISNIFSLMLSDTIFYLQMMVTQMGILQTLLLLFIFAKKLQSQRILTHVRDLWGGN